MLVLTCYSWWVLGHLVGFVDIAVSRGRLGVLGHLVGIVGMVVIRGRLGAKPKT